MKVLKIEKKVGIEAFLTDSPGMGGKLRFQPEDFLVKEVSEFPEKVKDGKYTIAEVTSTNWETNNLVNELSDRLHISRQRISFAGTKDKRAKTTQLMSFYDVSKDDLSEIHLTKVEISNIYNANKSVRLGALLGNKFEIIIRDLEKKTRLNDVKKTSKIIEKNKGFPNYFGIQRFGIIRPITHEVGRFILRGDFKKAVMTYIANPLKEEAKESYLLRKKLEKTKDFKDAFKNYPDKLNFEKAIINKLIQEPENYIDSLKELPKNLLTMFIYAYQSYLFNKILSERIKTKIPLNKALVGDIILPVKKGLIENRNILVKKNNLEIVNKQISKGKAAVSGILFGSESVFSKGEMGEIEHKIIEKEKIDPRDFIIPEIPRLSSAGSRRALLAPVKNLDFDLFDDDLNTNKKAVKIRFELQKGSYATSLLREFMKAEDIKNY
jgi:tRNA pseudouridine13 synthase